MTPTPPFRAEHVGSLLRPPELKATFARYRRGELDDSDYEAALGDAKSLLAELEARVAHAAPAR